MGSRTRSVQATAALAAMLLAAWCCFWPAHIDGMQLISRAVDEVRNHVDLSIVVSNYEKRHYCGDPIARVSFTMHELRSAFRGGQAPGDLISAERLFLIGQKLFNCILQRATAISSSTGARNDEPYASSAPDPLTSNEFHAFTVNHVSLPGLEGVDQLQFYCRGREGPTVTILTCAPRPSTLPGSLILRLDFEVLARKVATRESWCRITHNSIALGISSFIEAAVGLCTAFGYSAQLLRNEGFAVLDSIPDLSHLGSAALGFKPSPARYTQSHDSFFLAGVKPTSDEPSDRENDRGAAYFEPRHLYGFESWYGIGVNRHYFDQASHSLADAFQAALMTDGRTTVGNDCILRIAMPHGDQHLFREAGGGACRPNRPFLQCVQAIQKEVSLDALSTLLEEIKGLIPDVQPSSAHMLHLLSEPHAWRSLHALIGPVTARLFESPTQTAWYETDMHGSSTQMGDRRKANLQASSETVASELFRFAIWYIDIFPSQRYWESLKLGCVRTELAYVNAMGKIGTRQSTPFPRLTTNGQDTAAYVSMLSLKSITGGFGHPDVSSFEVQLADDEELRTAEKAAIILAHGKKVRPLQSQYSFEVLRAVSKLNPSERESDGALRRLWLNSSLFQKQGYLLITDVPARDGGLFDLKILCSKTGQFRRTRLTGWFSNYLCEPDYIELPNNDVTGVWRKGNMPVNRMLGIEFESRPPWRCGVSFLGDEHSLRETPVHGGHLITIMTGLCSLMGFKTGWILDSVKDLYTNELMKITMVLEKRVSFYEEYGFLLSVNTLKSRRRAETCVGSSVSEHGPTLVGVCHQPHDILLNPGFEQTVLHTLANRAYNTLHTVTFDCNSVLWKNCAQLYPLSVIDHRGNGCAFERHPLYQELRYLRPDKCNIGKRVGDCHKFVRTTLKCDRFHKAGCKYLAFLYSTFLYPGGDIEEEIPQVMRDHFEDVSIDLFQESRLYILDGIRKAAAKETKNLVTGHQEGTAQEEPVVNNINTILLEASNGKDRNFIAETRNMLLESIVFHDWTNTPQFWIRALYDYSSGRHRMDDTTKTYCPVGYAWAFITRVQGQLYRRPFHVAHTNLSATTLDGVNHEL